MSGAPVDRPLLVMLPVSPWSERARWALDHHRVVYKTRIHIPFLGERALRRIVGPAQERATVPVLVTKEGVLRDSTDIARFAERQGGAEPLFPPEHEAAIQGWIERANQMMAEGRGLVSAAILTSPGALDESLPPSTPGWLRPLLRPLTRYGARWFARKWDLRLDEGARSRERLRGSLQTLREALGGREYLLGSFTYADIVVATCLQGIQPIQGPSMPLGPAMRAAWTQPELAAEFADLIAWRDRVYAAKRPSRARAEG